VAVGRRRNHTRGFYELQTALLDLKAMIGEHGGLDPVIERIASWPEYVRDVATTTAESFLRPIPGRKLKGALALVEVAWIWGYLIAVLICDRDVGFDEALALQGLSKRYIFSGARRNRIEKECGLADATAIADRICVEACRGVLDESVNPQILFTLFLAIKFSVENGLATGFAADPLNP
jgi:hypothetical protein